MSNLVPTPTMSDPQGRPATKGTVIFSYTCVALTATALVAVLVFYFYHQCLRRRAPVTAAEAAAAGASAPGPDGGHHVGVDIAKLPEHAYTQSSRRRSGGDGAQCPVCLGTVQAGEMVRRLPLCKHLYHVECIDMWLASHATCPLCRSDVEPPPVEDDQAATTPTTTEPPPRALPV